MFVITDGVNNILTTPDATPGNAANQARTINFELFAVSFIEHIVHL